MELFFGILLTLSAICAIFIIVVSDGENIVLFTLGVLCTLLFIVGLVLVTEYHSPSIMPIDVYRGKTTLEITYKDSVAVDSVVVWK